jgi:hypothetical protein
MYSFLFPLTGLRSAANPVFRIHFALQVGGAALGTAGLWLTALNYELQVAATVWLGVVLAIAAFYRRAKTVQLWLVSIAGCFGAIIWIRVTYRLVQISPLWPGLLTGLLGSIILAATLFLAVNWNLTQKGKSLPAEVLARTVTILTVTVLLRLGWDLIWLGTQRVEDQHGAEVPLHSFLAVNDWERLLLAGLTGILVPLVVVLLRRCRPHLVDTRRLPGLLVVYVVVAEWFFKYYLLQYGIPL